MPINKFITNLDLARQAEILSGETAVFQGGMQLGLPFSGFPSGVDTSTIVSLGVQEIEYTAFSGGSGTTLFDVVNPSSPYYSVSAATLSASPYTIIDSGSITETVSATTYPTIMTFTALSGDCCSTPISVSFTPPIIQELYDRGLYDGLFNGLGQATIGTTYIDQSFYNVGSVFSGANLNMGIIEYGVHGSNPSWATGTTSGTVIEYSALTQYWSNPIYENLTSGLTLPITPISAETQTSDYVWTLTDSTFIDDNLIGLQYTGYNVTYSFDNVIDDPATQTYIIGGVTATLEYFSAGTLDYKNSIEWLKVRGNATIDERLTTDRLTINNPGTGTPINNLGITVDGDVVFGTTGATVTGLTFNDFTYDLTIGLDNGSNFTDNLGILASDIKVTGGTYNGVTGEIEFVNNSGGTFVVSGITTEFTGNTSGTCIADLHITNLHSCSPLNINPLDEGNVYFGSTSGITLDVLNQKVGIGTNNPTETLHVNGSFRLENGTEQSNYVLTSNSLGVGTWQPISGLTTGLTLSEVLSNGNDTGTNWIETENNYGIRGNYYGLGFFDNITFNTGNVRISSSDFTYGSYIETAPDTITIYSDNEFLVTGGGLYEGIKYTSDYSSNYINRSLVDKGYVDGLVSGSTYWTTQNGGLKDTEGGHTISGTSTLSIIAGGDSNIIDTSLNSGILGGENNSISGANMSVIIGGSGNTLTGAAARSVILGGIGITGDTSDTVYTPNLVVNNSGNDLLFSTSRSNLTIYSEDTKLYSPNITNADEILEGISLSNFGYVTSGGTAIRFLSTDGTSGFYTTSVINGVVVGPNQMDITFQNEYSGPSNIHETLRIKYDGTIMIPNTPTQDNSIQNVIVRDSDGSLKIRQISTGSTSYWTSGSSGNYSIKVINDTTTDATGNYAVAEGYNTLASGVSSHAEGSGTTASGVSSHAEGGGTIASGNRSHAEGDSTIASGSISHAEGRGTLASGYASHAEGYLTIASGDYSHAEGAGSESIGNRSHAEGGGTIAGGDYSHSGGYRSIASGSTSFIHSADSLVTGDRSVVLGGYNMTGTTDDTVYVPYLNIRDLGIGSPVNNLGIDSSGNVVSANTGSFLAAKSPEAIVTHSLTAKGIPDGQVISGYTSIFYNNTDISGTLTTPFGTFDNTTGLFTTNTDCVLNIQAYIHLKANTSSTTAWETGATPTQIGLGICPNNTTDVYVGDFLTILPSVSRGLDITTGITLRVLSGTTFRVKVLNQTSRAYPGPGVVSGDYMRFSITRVD